MTTEVSTTSRIDFEACDPDHVCVRPILRRAFGLFWDHAWLFVSAHLIIFMIFVAGSFVLTMSGNLLLGPFILGAYKIALRVVRNENTDLTDLLSGFEYFLPAFIANLLVHLLTAIGFLLLFFPGLVVLLAYTPTYLFILDENLGFWAAMEKSRRMVLGNFKQWVVLGLVVLAVNMAGALCLGVGLLVTIPFSNLVFTLAYEEELLARKKREEQVRLMPPDPLSA